jgi:hypothetical protein
MCVFFEAGSEDLLAGHLYCATFFGKGILFDRFESVSAAYPPWPSIGLGWVSGRPGDLCVQGVRFEPLPKPTRTWDSRMDRIGSNQCRRVAKGPRPYRPPVPLGSILRSPRGC